MQLSVTTDYAIRATLYLLKKEELFGLVNCQRN